MERLPSVVHTPRLLLRTWTVDDAPAMSAAIEASVDHLRPWMDWAADEPLPLNTRVEVIRGMVSGWEEGREAIYGVFLGNTVVGGCGFHRRGGPEMLEIGYWIHVDHVRHGYATELAAALTGAAFGINGIHRVEIHHDRANVASRGVPAKLGFRFLGERSRAKDAPPKVGVDCAWAVTRPEWATRRR